MVESKICSVCKKEFNKEDVRQQIKRYNKPDDGRMNPENYLNHIWNQRKYCSNWCSYVASTRISSQRQYQKRINKLGGRCARCGYSQVLDIHHIILRSEGGSNSNDNLIVLCPNCHALFHRGLIDKSELFLLKFKDKEGKE